MASEEHASISYGRAQGVSTSRASRVAVHPRRGWRSVDQVAIDPPLGPERMVPSSDVAGNGGSTRVVESIRVMSPGRCDVAARDSPVVDAGLHTAAVDQTQGVLLPGGGGSRPRRQLRAVIVGGRPGWRAAVHQLVLGIEGEGEHGGATVFETAAERGQPERRRARTPAQGHGTRSTAVERTAMVDASAGPRHPSAPPRLGLHADPPVTCGPRIGGAGSADVGEGRLVPHRWSRRRTRRARRGTAADHGRSNQPAEALGAAAAPPRRTSETRAGRALMDGHHAARRTVLVDDVDDAAAASPRPPAIASAKPCTARCAPRVEAISRRADGAAVAGTTFASVPVVAPQRSTRPVGRGPADCGPTAAPS